jgi:two-component system response regulator YesN
MLGLLIADDEDMVRKIVAGAVNCEALQLGPVQEARTGLEAVSLARQMRPDIILMDVKMPGMNGLEATRLIRTELPQVKVVFLTAYDEFAYSQEALRLGASDYLLKPVRPAALVVVLTRLQGQIHLERQQQDQESETISRLKATLPLVEVGLVHDLVFRSMPAETVAECLRSCLGKEMREPVVLLIEIDDPAYPHKEIIADTDGHLTRLLADIVGSVIPDPKHTLLGQIEPGVLVMIVSAEGALADPKAIRSLGDTIRSAVESSAPVTVTVGIRSEERRVGKEC